MEEIGNQIITEQGRAVLEEEEGIVGPGEGEQTYSELGRRDGFWEEVK